MAVIGSLSVKLGLITVEWEQATAKAKREARQLQQSFDDLTVNLRTLAGHFKSLGGAMGLGAVGFGALLSSTMAYADEVTDLADGFGISIAKTLQFKDALVASGSSADDAKKLLTGLFTKIQGAKDGNDKLIKSFEDIGISVQDLQNLPVDQLVTHIFSSVAAAAGDDAVQKVARLRALLGKGGLGLDIDETARRMNASIAVYKDAEGAIHDMGKTADNVQQSMANLKMAFAQVISPFTGNGLISVQAFKDILYTIIAVSAIKGLWNMYQALVLISTALQKSAKYMAIIDALTLAASGNWVGMGLAVGGTMAAYVAIDSVVESIESGISGVNNQANELVSTTEQWKKELKESGDIISNNLSRQFQESMGIISPQVQAARDKITLAKELASIEHQEAMLKVQAVTGDQTRVKLAEIELARRKEIAQLKSQHTQDLLDNPSAEKKKGIDDAYAINVAKANQKAKDSVALVNAETHKQAQLLYATVEANKASLEILKEEGTLKLKMIDMDKYAAQEAKAEFDYKKAKSDIENKANQDRQKAIGDGIAMSGVEEEKSRALKEAEENRKQTLAEINIARETEIANLERTNAQQKKLLAFDIAAAELKEQSKHMTKYEQAIADENLSTQRRLLEIKNQIADTEANEKSGKRKEEILEGLRQQMDAEIELSAIRKRSIEQDELRRSSFVEGWKGAMDSYMQNVKGAGEVAGDIFGRVMSGMEAAIDEFAHTGKFVFKDFAKSVIQDIMAMILKWQMWQMIRGIWNMFQGGIGSGVNSVNNAGIEINPNMRMAASGGDIDSPTIVGENGAELFVPKRAGTIIPNARVSDYLGKQGGSGLTVNGTYINNMSAIDTQSATQFISKNRQAVWAANQSASRGIPATR